MKIKRNVLETRSRGLLIITVQNPTHFHDANIDDMKTTKNCDCVELEGSNRDIL
jgi:hypothetical protein